MLPSVRDLDRLAEQLTSAAVTVRRLDAHDAWRNHSRSFLYFRDLFRKLAPSLVHLHVPWVSCAWAVTIAARAARVPITVRTEHNPIPDRRPVCQREKIRVLDGAVDHVVFISREVADAFAAGGRDWLDRWSVIPNAVSAGPMDPADRERTRAALALPANAPVAVMAGHLEERDGALDFIRAAGAAGRKGSRLHFLLMSAGPLPDFGERLARDVGIAGRLHFAPANADLGRVLSASDLYVQPSRHDGRSIAMLEGLAAGLPVVTTRVPGLDELLSSGAGAIVCEPGDVRALAQGMLALETEEPLRRRLVDLARPWVSSKLSHRVMHESYEGLYARLGLSSPGVAALAAVQPHRALRLQ